MELEEVVTALNNGWLRIYDGVKPSHSGRAISESELLAELRFGKFNIHDRHEFRHRQSLPRRAVTSEIASGKCLRKGTARWFRLFEADGFTPILDGTVGLEASGCELSLSNIDFLEGALVELLKFSVSEPL